MSWISNQEEQIITAQQVKLLLNSQMWSFAVSSVNPFAIFIHFHFFLILDCWSDIWRQQRGIKHI